MDQRKTPLRARGGAGGARKDVRFKSPQHSSKPILIEAAKARSTRKADIKQGPKLIQDAQYSKRKSHAALIINTSVNPNMENDQNAEQARYQTNDPKTAAG